MEDSIGDIQDELLSFISLIVTSLLYLGLLIVLDLDNIVTSSSYFNSNSSPIIWLLPSSLNLELHP